MTEVYTPDEVQMVVDLARANPAGFLRLAQRHCTTVTADEVKRSMHAWGIDHTEEGNARNSGDRSTRRRQNNRYNAVSA